MLWLTLADSDAVVDADSLALVEADSLALVEADWLALVEIDRATLADSLKDFTVLALTKTATNFFKVNGRPAKR